MQDDTTADLLFPFSRLVADLSQLLTLEPGDIILTGTPAGASVAVPGDVLEVEVGAGALSTGRLSTRVSEGATPDQITVVSTACSCIQTWPEIEYSGETAFAT